MLHPTSSIAVGPSERDTCHNHQGALEFRQTRPDTAHNVITYGALSQQAPNMPNLLAGRQTLSMRPCIGASQSRPERQIAAARRLENNSSRWIPNGDRFRLQGSFG